MGRAAEAIAAVTQGDSVTHPKMESTNRRAMRLDIGLALVWALAEVPSFYWEYRVLPLPPAASFELEPLNITSSFTIDSDNFVIGSATSTIIGGGATNLMFSDSITTTDSFLVIGTGSAGVGTMIEPCPCR